MLVNFKKRVTDMAEGADGQRTNRYEVMIYGEKVMLVTDEPESYIRELAEYVDCKMTELFKDTNMRILRHTTCCILFGMNIADELFSVRRERAGAIPAETLSDGAYVNVSVYEEQIAQLIKNVGALHSEIKELKKQVSTLQEEKKSIEAEYEEQTKFLDTFTAEYEILEEEIREIKASRKMTM